MFGVQDLGSQFRAFGIGLGAICEHKAWVLRKLTLPRVQI